MYMAAYVYHSKRHSKTPQRFTPPKWRNKRPSPYQSNTAAALCSFLLENKNTRRADVYATIQRRWHLMVEERRHYAKGGVGSMCWLPRRGCLRVQVGSSKIDSRKPCFRYAPVVEIFDLYAIGPH